MTLVTDLKRCGLDADAGVTVGGTVVPVTITERAPTVTLQASAAAPEPPDRALFTATMGAPGDTAFTWSGGVLLATRSLAEPGLGVVYDAVFDLAKAVVNLARLLTDLATLEGTPAAPPAPPAGPAVAAVQPTPAAVAIPATASFWFFVEDDQRLVASGDPSRVVGVLRPGTWYQATAEQGGWVCAKDESGVEGWLGASAVKGRRRS